MDRERRLLRHGFALFLPGLLSGLAAYRLANPRMAVVAHLEGILNGLFLVVLGLAWPRIALTGRLAAGAWWTALVGAYGNWAITLFSAVVGASQPKLAGAGFAAAPWAERLLALSPVAGVAAPILCTGLVLWGLRARSSA